MSLRVNFGVKINISPAFLSGKHAVHCLGRLNADFRSCLVARSIKPIKCVLKTLLRRSTHVAPIPSQKANQASFA